MWSSRHCAQGFNLRRSNDADPAICADNPARRCEPRTAVTHASAYTFMMNTQAVSIGPNRRTNRRGKRLHAGFAYVEVLIAAALIAVVLPAALQASWAATSSADQLNRSAARHEARVARMELLKGLPYSDLLSAAAAAGTATAPSPLSDDLASDDAVVVYLARYDGDADPFVVTDPNVDGDGNPFTGYRGLLWVRIVTQDAPGELLTLVRPNHVVASLPRG